MLHRNRNAGGKWLKMQAFCDSWRAWTSALSTDLGCGLQKCRQGLASGRAVVTANRGPGGTERAISRRVSIAPSRCQQTPQPAPLKAGRRAVRGKLHVVVGEDLSPWRRRAAAGTLRQAPRADSGCARISASSPPRRRSCTCP